MATKTLLTAEQFLELPTKEDHLCELVDGELRDLPFPRPRHQLVQQKITRALDNFAEAQQLGVVLPANAPFLLTRNPDSIRSPDVAFVRQERAEVLNWDTFIEGGPDLAVEIVSPWDKASELRRKIQQYLAAGTAVVWVIHPVKREVEVYRSSSEKPELLRETETLECPELLPGLRISLADLF